MCGVEEVSSDEVIHSVGMAYPSVHRRFTDCRKKFLIQQYRSTDHRISETLDARTANSESGFLVDVVRH